MPLLFFFFFFNDTATTEIYTLSLHDALPISLQGDFRVRRGCREGEVSARRRAVGRDAPQEPQEDRKSTRLNSSHLVISYAVFCLKKKKKINITRPTLHTLQPVYRCVLLTLEC